MSNRQLNSHRPLDPLPTPGVAPNLLALLRMLWLPVLVGGIIWAVVIYLLLKLL